MEIPFYPDEQDRKDALEERDAEIAVLKIRVERYEAALRAITEAWDTMDPHPASLADIARRALEEEAAS